MAKREAKKKYSTALKMALASEGENDAAIFALLSQASEEGAPEATYALATWHLFGTHVPKDIERGTELLKQAARSGVPSALYDLGVSYETGIGVPANAAEAFRCYLKAAIRGEKQSFSEVGRCYWYGIGTRSNKRMAGIWLERAIELGVDDFYSCGDEIE